MHKNKLIKKGSKQPLKFQWGGISGLLGGLQNTTNTPTAETANQMSNQVPSSIDPMTGKPKVKNGDFLNSAISGSLMGLMSGASSINGINGNSSLNSDQKKIMTGDAVANTLSQVGSAFGPVGAIAGAGLGVLNSLGGKLLGTPKVLKDFNVNTDVSTSGGYGGIAANAASTSASAKSYDKAGLFGKLFGGKKNLINSANMSNSWQSMAADQVRNNTTAINASLGGADMAASRVNNSLYGGNLWNNGSIMYGQKGGIMKHGMGGQSSSLTDRSLAKDMPAKRYTGGTEVTQLNDGKTKTYEQYKKLLGAAAAIDFKKIKIRKEKLAPLALPGGSQTMKYEEGGIMKPMNVIVDGALHAHKHDLKEHENLEDAPITLKGIPVISQAEGGEIVQHAEVERDELILHYDCSKKLEALYEIGDEESMIIAGKLLTKELIHNTKDSENGILENA